MRHVSENGPGFSNYKADKEESLEKLKTGRKENVLCVDGCFVEKFHTYRQVVFSNSLPEMEGPYLLWPES